MTDDLKSRTLNHLIAVACTCKRHNTAEWMSFFAEVLNAAIAACGSDGRVTYPGKWSNEFHLEIGAEKVEAVPKAADSLGEGRA